MGRIGTRPALRIEPAKRVAHQHKAQASDAGHATPVDRCQKLQGRKALVANHNQLATGQPAACLQRQLPGCRQLLVRLPSC